MRENLRRLENQNMEVDQQVYHLKKLVEELTTSGKDKLDENTFKKVKKICKQSDDYVIELFKLVNKQLRKKHAEIRFSAFQICDEIFRRSHCFREILLKDFKQFTNLVMGLDPRNPLPKPHVVAQKLKQKCVETIQQWYDVYGEGYITLKLGYKYLRDCKKVDFAELTARTEAQRQRDEEERRRAEEVKRKRIERINNELELKSSEIKSTVMQFQNGVKLLIPDVHNFFIPLENDDEDMIEGGFLVEEEEDVETKENTEGGFLVEEEDVETKENTEGGFLVEEEEVKTKEISEYGSDYMRSHGIMKGMNVTINVEDISKVKETSDNEIVVQNLRETVNILRTKYLPQVKKWEETMRPHSEGNGILVKRILDLKNLVERNVKMFESIKIETQNKEMQLPHTKVIEEFDSDDDDDFIEVPFDDPRVIRAAASEAALLGIAGPSWGEVSQQVDDPLNQPSTSQVLQAPDSVQLLANLKENKRKSSVGKYPDDFLDKDHYKPIRHHNPLAGLSQIWQAAPELHEQEEMESTGGILGIATQRVNYERSWEPVKWACNAPLATGRLCPRKDREKCPLHGPIIPRDELGQPVSAQDAARERATREQYERDHPAWQDPHLLAEIKATTGIDLKIPKGKAKRKPKYENLTNIKKTTPYDRLAKKVFSCKAMKRVNKAYQKEHSSNAWGSSNFNFNQT